MIKKIKNFLYEMDFIWSVPVAFLGFVTYPILGQWVFGDGFGAYDPSFFHAAIYAGLVIILFNSFTQLGILFNFPALYNFYLGEGFKDLPTIQKCVIFLLVYSFYFFSLLTVWRLLV